MEHPKKELIEGIADLFEDYEEVYVPGEWEAFSQQQKRKKYPFLGQWVKIAAALFLLLSVLVYSVSDNLTHHQDVVDIKVKETQSSGEAAESTGLIGTPGQVTAMPAGQVGAGRLSASGAAPILAYQSAKNKNLSGVGLSHGPKPVEQTATDSLISSVTSQVYAHNNIRTANRGKDEQRDSVVLAKTEPLSTIDFLIAESKKPGTKAKKKEAGSKWDFGLEVMPTVTQTNMNVGAGLTTAYRISDKLSISSGISLLQLQSGVDVGGSTGEGDMSIARALSDRELTAVNANIKAIDIPLGLVYKVNKHFYTSAGLSYFNVINEKRSNTYVQTAQISQSVSNALTGASYSYKAVASEQVSESVPDEPLRGNSYLGFFNFSLGREQTLFNKYNIRIEPFIKIPVGKLSDQELKLMNSGLKLQLSF
jgi:hypothetical protein